MGTFHDNLGEWHGHTVVLETTDGRTVIGRCHEARPEAVDLVGADIYTDGRNGQSREQYFEHVRAYGYWEQHPRLRIPGDEVESVRLLRDRLSELDPATLPPSP